MAMLSLAAIAPAQAQLELSAPEQPVPPTPSLADANLASDTGDLPEGAEVMVTGPLHEAFAEQFSDQAEPGIVIRKQPPELINEVPPEYRPDGDDIVWIPGYWGWDPEREDFLWITGIWRQAPPDRSWVPGYWAEVPEGYQWIAGFWAPNQTGEIRYLPPPPEPLAADPSTPAPSDEHFWIPGQWSYANNDYQWRAGYWTMGYPDWVWVPDRYVWTPSGCIYRAGYWDYIVAQRGTVFCPIYWSRPVANYQFRPSYVVSTGPTLLANLFVYPRYHHYFFGNYYSSRYLGQTMYPWVSYGQQSRNYDPLYGYYRSQYRDNDYINRLTRLHNYYAANANFQPPRTLAAQNEHHHDARDRQDLNFHAMQLNQVVNLSRSGVQDHMQLVKLADSERQRIQTSLDPAKEIWRQRAQFEAKSAGSARDKIEPGPGNPANIRHWNLPATSKGVRLGSISVGNTPRSSDRGTADEPSINNRDRNNAARNEVDRNVDRNSERNDRDRNSVQNPRMNNRDDSLPGDTNRDINRDGIVNERDRQVTNSDNPRDRKPNDVRNRDAKNPITGNDAARGANQPGTPNRDPVNRDSNRDTRGRNPLDLKSMPGRSPTQPGNVLDSLPSNLPGTSPGLPPRSGNSNPANNPSSNSPQPRDRTPRVNPSQPVKPSLPSIAPGEPNPSATRRGAGSVTPNNNIQNDLQKMREMSQRSIPRRNDANVAPRRAPQLPSNPSKPIGGGKKEPNKN